jgi:hypothetical protein
MTIKEALAELESRGFDVAPEVRTRVAALFGRRQVEIFDRDGRPAIRFRGSSRPPKGAPRWTIRPRGAWPRILPDGRAVIPRFEATVELRDDQRRLSVMMEIEVDDEGRPRCVRLSNLEPLDGTSVTAETLRIPIPKLERQAAAEAAAWCGRPSGDGFAMVVGEERVAIYERAMRSRRRRAGTPSLKEVAAVVRAASERGENGADAVADEFQLAPSAAYRWIDRARGKGFLPLGKVSGKSSPRPSRS